MSEPDQSHEKWRMTPVQVLCRAYERVHGGTHLTARTAIGWEPLADAERGSPITAAWHLFLDAYGFKPDLGGRESARLRYACGNAFSVHPVKKVELEAIGRAIAFAKRKLAA